MAHPRFDANTWIWASPITEERVSTRTSRKAMWQTPSAGPTPASCTSVCVPTNRGAPGADHLDWSGIRAAFDEIDICGAAVLKPFTPHRAAIASAASVWRPLATSQDAIVIDGLAHLKATFAPVE